MSDDAPDISSPIVGGPLEDDTSSPPRPTIDEGLGAAASNAWLQNPLGAGPQASDRTLGEATDLFNQGTNDQAPGAPSNVPAPTVSADDANAAAKKAGAQLTPFTAPVYQASLDAMIANQTKRQQSADVISRTSGVINTLGQFGVGALVSLADPLNDMAMMIPGAPEAWTARAIEGLGGGILARTAARAGSGALQGAAGMAALIPEQYANATQDHEDFSWGDALRNVAFGAALGTAGGALHGVLSRAAPETTEAVMKAALARVMTDDPRGVDIQGLLDHGDASQAADRLGAFQKKQLAIEAERAALEQGPAPNRAGDIAEAQRRMEDAYVQERQFRREAGAVTDAHPATTDPDPATQTRLDEIKAELGAAIPKARRASLIREQEMLTEGLHPGLASDVTTSPESLLEIARSQAQREGLTTAADRARATGQAAEADVARIQKEEAAAQTARASSDRTTRIRQFQLDGTEAATQGMMEKEVRRYAAKTADANGSSLEPAEVTRIAREIRTAGNGEVQDTIAYHLNTLARRSEAFPVRESLDRVATATASLRAEAQGAARDMASRAMNPTDPELAQTQRAAAQTIDTAPKLEGIEASKDTAEASAMLADKKAEYDGLVSSGALAEHPSLADEGKVHEDYGKAVDAYGKTCAFGG